MITTRILPAEEWSKIAHTDLGAVVMHVNPEAVTVIVAEDAQGVIAGCWALVNFMHLEGMWVDPDHRGKGVVLRHLWNAVCEAASAKGIGSVFTGAASPLIAEWITLRGGQRLPFDSFVIPLEPIGRVH